MRRVTLTSISDLDTLPFDQVIDVRSPAEYAEDHVPGAINLPSLSNEERARVGTVYVQESKFLARRMGAALVARNVATHLETVLVDKPADYRPLVYCWRGGQRSGSVALILGQIGWQVGVLEGGWKSWRRLVQEALYELPVSSRVMILDGNTGTAKTALLHKVAALGGQVIDLEGLARHRGSLFGLARGETQPAQKAFESAVALAISRLDQSRPVLVEAESNRIGTLRLPPSLWQAMQAAPRIQIVAPLAARATYLAQAYADVAADPVGLQQRIEALAPYQPRATLSDWHALAQSGAFEALAAGLMEHHYDPRYARTKLRQGADADTVLTTETLETDALDRLARRIVALLE